MIIENRLEKRIALVTGATSGIGEAVAKSLAKEKANLILTGRKKELLEKLKNELEKEFAVEVKILEFDVRNLEDIKNSINSLEEKWKNISILVNNAGLALGLDKLYENSFEDIDTIIDTNIKGLVYVTKVVVPLMIKSNLDGTIINIGSVAGDAAYAGGAMYCASKSAVKTISDGLRIDLIDTRLKVTNIKPGLVETNFSITRFKGDIDRAKSVYKGIEPLVADDVAQTVVYVANLPENIHIGEISLLCNKQADGRTVYKI